MIRFFDLVTKESTIIEMPPINPVEILDAFAMFLTENGGIMDSVDQMKLEKIYDIMKNCSTKLVSKCIYFQILMSTTANVLEQFLTIGGWDLICQWLKTSRDTGSITFLIELLKLLNMVPMNIERLRQNECPKIVKKLCKHENEDISTKANQIIKKWTKIIHALSEKNNPNTTISNNSSSGTKTGDKKRKSLDNSPPNSNNNNNSDNNKKPKIDEDSKIRINGEMTGELKMKLIISNEKFTTLPTNNNQIVTIKRPVTAKVKQGKARLDLTTPSSITPKTNDKKILKNNLDSKKSIKIPAKINNNNGIQVKSPTTKTFLKDSTSFMDALSMVPEVGNIKKRRKINNIRDNNNSTSTESKLQSQENVMSNRNNSNSSDGISDSNTGNGSSEGSNSSMSVNDDKLVTNQPGNENQQPQQQQQQPFSFYKDILDEKSSKTTDDDQEWSKNKATSSPEQQDDIGEDSHSKPEMDFDSTVCDHDGQSGQKKPKSILCYIKKSSKKSVRWPDDDKDLEQVKYFELDETERINVTRPSADMKRFDMKHEAQMMSEAKKGRCFTYAPWRLIPIDLDPSNVLIQRGCNSKEKIIQTERMKTTLECFYLYNQIPDNPDEPDPCFEISGDGNEKCTLIIPLVEENAPGMPMQEPYFGPETNVAMGPIGNPNSYTVPNSSDTMGMGPASSIFATGGSEPQGGNYLPPQTYSNPTPVGGVNQNFVAPGTGPPSTMPPPPNQSLPPAFQQGNPAAVGGGYMAGSQTNFDTYNGGPSAPPYQPIGSNPQSTNSVPPPPFGNAPSSGIFSDYNHQAPPDSYGGAPPPGSGGFHGANQSSSPPSNMYNSYDSQTPNTLNFYNNPSGGGPPPAPPVVDNNFYNNNSNNNNYWPPGPPGSDVSGAAAAGAAVSNYPPGGPPQVSKPPPPPQQQQQAPPPPPGKFGRGRGRNRGFHPRNASEICKFFLRSGKCKFENRCNFSHVLENNQKPPIRF